MTINLLKIDKDCFVDEDWIEDYVKVIVEVCKIFNVSVKMIEFCYSKKKGIHFYVTLASSIESSFANRLQWLLGDDCRRVDFNRARIKSNLVEWNKLFEKMNVKLKRIYPLSKDTS